MDNTPYRYHLQKLSILYSTDGFVEGNTMTREEFAERCKWPVVIWVFGIINPFFMLPQFMKILDTGNASTISLGSLLVLFTLQVVFGIHGFIIRQTIYVVSNALGVGMTILTTITAIYFGASW